LPYMTNAAGETVYSLFKENNLLLTAK